MEMKTRTTDVPVSTKKNRASEGGGKSLVKFIVRTIIKEMNTFKDGVHRIIFFSSEGGSVVKFQPQRKITRVD